VYRVYFSPQNCFLLPLLLTLLPPPTGPTPSASTTHLQPLPPPNAPATPINHHLSRPPHAHADPLHQIGAAVHHSVLLSPRSSLIFFFSFFIGCSNFLDDGIYLICVFLRWAQTRRMPSNTQRHHQRPAPPPSTTHHPTRKSLFIYFIRYFSQICIIFMSLSFFDASLKLRMGNGSRVRACFVFVGNMFVKMPE
jgi:hypothetical protein